MRYLKTWLLTGAPQMKTMKTAQLGPSRQSLPTQWVDASEFRYLERKARERNISVGELVKEALTPLLEQDEVGTGKRIVLHIPERIWRAFNEFFEGDEPIISSSMVACLEVNGEDFDAAMRTAREETQGKG